jgi:hopene-associated glycosyltransferase HpnB
MKIEELPANSTTEPARRVAVIVPARDEAQVIGQAIGSLLRQEYAGSVQIFLVDDHSSDETVKIVRRVAEEDGGSDRLTVVQAGTLPADWTGKLWALSQGVQAAASFNPDYYWFTDADIVHERDNLAGLIGRAEAGGLDLVSLMVKLRCESFAERMLIPAFVFFFFKLYPPAWVARTDRRTAAAAGGCILIRSAALTRIGGIASIRNQLIDDCALARAVKSQGSIWLALTSKARSMREYESFGQIGHMISRTAFTQLRHSVLLLCGAMAGMTITYAMPPLLLASRGSAAVFGLCAWLLMTSAYRPILRFYNVSWLWAPLLPVIAAFYTGATIYSALQYWTGQGGSWKGRIQDPQSSPAQVPPC